MLPELFRIPILGFPVFGFGLMLIVGFLLAAQLCKWLSRRVGIDPEVMINAGIIALISGVIGSRLSHVLENIAYYTSDKRSVWENFREAINITDGGLTFYGGFLLATPIVIAYGLYKKVPILRGMDVVAPCLMVGLALGRVGCFLNGCCYGEQLEWGVSFPYGSPAYVEQYEEGTLPVPPPQQLMTERGHLIDRRVVADRPELKAIAHAHRSAPVLPTQLYSTFNSLLVTAVLVCFFTLRPAPGRVFALMLMMEGLTRFLLELLRVEPPVIGTGTDVLTALPPLSISMIIGLALVPAGAIMWYFTGRFAPPRDAEPASGEPAPATA